MTPEQQHLLQLLEEFNGLCEACGATYSLVEHDLAWVEKSVNLAGYEIEVLMSWDGFQTFAAYVKSLGLDDREIESLDNNPLMPGWYFRYVDSSSTMIALDYLRVRRAHGVGINIHIARSLPPSKRHPAAWARRKWLTLVERGMAQGISPDYQYDKDAAGRTHKRAGAVTGLLRKTMGTDRFSQWAKGALQKTAASTEDLEGETAIISPTSGTNHILPERFLVDLDTGILENTRAMVAHNRIPYLDRLYGERWREPNHGVWYRRESYMTFYSALIPYAEFMPRIMVSIVNDSFLDKRQKWLRYFHTIVEPQRTAQLERWNIFYFLDKRYADWKRYAPHKERILTWFAEGKYDLLWMYLKALLIHIDSYSKKELPLVIDEDIWNVALKLYRLNGYTVHADRLQELHDEKPLPAIEGPEAEAYLERIRTESPEGATPLSEQ